MGNTPDFRLDGSVPSVHVWSTDLDVSDERLTSLAALLDPEEAARARRFHFERDRRRFITSRGVLRTLLGRYLEHSPAHLAFAYSARGKPFVVPLDGTSRCAVRFNLSHSYGRALFAFARDREVGVDLEAGERLGADWPGLVRRIFSAREQNELKSLPSEIQRAAFLNGWTRKEAFLKATGQGIVDGLPSIEVTLKPAVAPALLAAAGGFDPQHWTVYDLRVDSHYAAALVVEGADAVAVERFSFEG